MALAVVTLRQQTGGVVVGHVTDRGILAAQRSLWDAEPVALPRWGAMTEQGAILERTPPALVTCAAEIAPTPTVWGLHNRKGVSAKAGDGLATWVRERNRRPFSEHVGGSLSPDWEEWLMGWPVGWTKLDDCDPTAWLAAHLPASL